MNNKVSYKEQNKCGRLTDYMEENDEQDSGDGRTSSEGKTKSSD